MPNNIKINSVNQNYETLDIGDLQSDLDLARLEEMGEHEYALAKFKDTGVRHQRIAVAEAKEFGLRKAFWDVYSPVEKSETGRWMVEKDATSGEEFITLKKES